MTDQDRRLISSRLAEAEAKRQEEKERRLPMAAARRSEHRLSRNVQYRGERDLEYSGSSASRPEDTRATVFEEIDKRIKFSRRCIRVRLPPALRQRQCTETLTSFKTKSSQESRSAPKSDFILQTHLHLHHNNHKQQQQ